MSSSRRLLFAIAHELRRPVVEVEQLSWREVKGWITYFEELAGPRAGRQLSEDEVRELVGLGHGRTA